MWGILSIFFMKNFMSSEFFFFSFLSLNYFLLVDYSWPKFYGYFLFLEPMNSLLIILTILICCLMMYENLKTPWLIFKMMLLKMFLILSFLVKELILFFVFFELSILPTAYMMFAWGVQPERLSASFYFIVYALMGSFPLLSNMIYLTKNLGEYKFSFNFKNSIEYFNVFKENQILVFFWIFSFLMKLPMYGLHLWLPKAHVEAPVYGSMILAAVLLKLGGYGLIRLSLFKLMENCFFLFWILISLMMVGMISFRKVDIKALIAYSSISHMALTLFLYSYFSLKNLFALILILVGHGFISSSLFQSFNLLYKTTQSRNIFLKKALNLYSRLFYFLFFFILCLNSSLPLNLTFFPEILVGVTLFYLNKFSVIIFCFSVFLMGLYKIKLFLITNQGFSFKSYNNSYLYMFPLFISFLHIFLNFIIMFGFSSIC